MLPAIAGPKLEPVSPGLKATLVHADRQGSLYGICYSPDGNRIIAGGYPSGIVEVWEAVTGRQVTKFDAGRGYRATAEYFCVSPDWKTLFAPTNGERKRTPFERAGQRLNRWEFDGEVRAWDLETGDFIRDYRHDPPRNIRLMWLSPDGSAFLTGEELPGESEGGPARAVSLWNAKTGEFRPLPDGVSIVGTFSPDGRTIAIPAEDDDGYYTEALKLFDADSLTEKLSIPVPQEFASAGLHGFTPGGALLLGYVRVFPAQREWRTWESSLRLWDAATGEELASFATREKNLSFDAPVFSPDGSLFAAVNSPEGESHLHLFDVAARCQTATIVLTAKADQGERPVVSQPAFSADGRWLAVVTQSVPDDLGRREPEPEELRQPRIHLVDVRRRTVAETLVAPQGFIGSLCFSPDGQTLAVGGHGKVLLWDLSERVSDRRISRSAQP